MQKYLLECCVDSVESAILAQKGGADRLELCSNLIIGGTTPTLALYEQIRQETDIRIHALIRPRFGDFLYSEQEFAVIKREVRLFREAGAEGVVIGCLTREGDLDLPRLSSLKETAGSMSVTLHRAFDMCRDPFAALAQAKNLGIDTILTSGQAPSCLEGIELLTELDRAAAGAITILAGAGIQAAAVKTLLEKTALHAFHMSGKEVLPSGMQYHNPRVSMGLPGFSEYELWRTDPDRIRAVRKLLDQKRPETSGEAADS